MDVDYSDDCSDSENENSRGGNSKHGDGAEDSAESLKDKKPSLLASAAQTLLNLSLTAPPIPQIPKLSVVATTPRAPIIVTSKNVASAIAMAMECVPEVQVPPTKPKDELSPPPAVKSVIVRAGPSSQSVSFMFFNPLLYSRSTLLDSDVRVTYDHKMGSFCIYKQQKRISILCYGEFMESAILHNIR